jgi:glutamine synthetase
VALAGNDHRLGANEAPPAIISVFLGAQLTEVVSQLIDGVCDPSQHGGCLTVGVSTLPSLPKDATDRNRTSPFAFTGNKFEFRAVGSSQSIALPLITLNTIVAESIDFLVTSLETAVIAGTDLNVALQALLKGVLAESKDILFDGDNYTEEWVAEAARRGLPNLKSAVEALPAMIEPQALTLFSTYGVFTEREQESRCTVMLENYIKAVNIEAQLTLQVAQTVILPAAVRYTHQLAKTVLATREVLAPVMVGAGAALESCPLTSLLNEVATLTGGLKTAIDTLATVHTAAHDEDGDELGHATYFHDIVIPAMLAVRTQADALELTVDDEVWPLPKYREMLFIY